jgi:hypothetical protein
MYPWRAELNVDCISIPSMVAQMSISCCRTDNVGWLPYEEDISIADLYDLIWVLYGY